MEYKLPKNFEGVRIFSSEGVDGSMSRDNIAENLPKFAKSISLDQPIAYCEQVHGKSIEVINNDLFSEDCDGLVTGESIALAIKSADCIPLLFFAPERGYIGAIHVGRRSLLSGIITDSLKDIFERTSLSPSEVNFFLAAHIRADNYPIGDDVIAEVQNSSYSPSLHEINNQTCFDLTKSLIADLVKIGALRENIFDPSVDNFSDERFFSYRRGDRDKLFITIISKLGS